jgi:Sec-independent protein translocase protein TatA
MFDISFGEFVFVVAAASWLVGRRDLPIATKYGGKALGRAIGYMMRLRTTVEELTAGSNEMNTLRQDMKQGYEEFNRVSMEVRNVGRLGGMATAGMYGGVGGMAKHAMTDAAMNGMGGGQTHEGATPKASGVVLSGQPMAG